MKAQFDWQVKAQESVPDSPKKMHVILYFTIAEVGKDLPVSKMRLVKFCCLSKVRQIQKDLKVL